MEKDFKNIQDRLGNWKYKYYLRLKGESLEDVQEISEEHYQGIKKVIKDGAQTVVLPHRVFSVDSIADMSMKKNEWFLKKGE